MRLLKTRRLGRIESRLCDEALIRLALAARLAKGIKGCLKCAAGIKHAHQSP